jgi:hypothetical protein
MKHLDRHKSQAVRESSFGSRVAPVGFKGAHSPLTRLDIATLAAGVTPHGTDAALQFRLVAAGLLSEDPRTGGFYLTPKGYVVLEDNGYSFEAKHGWRIDPVRVARLLQKR